MTEASAVPPLHGRCARCRHAYSFHGKGTSHCRATGCKAHAGKPCPDFVWIQSTALSTSS